MNVAYIGQIIDLQPIPNRDRIVAATVICGKGGKWQGVVVKDQFHVGDLCEVYLQDAQLPVDDPRFAFMAAKHYRVRMMRFAGVPSEVVVMPLVLEADPEDVGLAIDNIYSITKYEKPLPANIGGEIGGNFPSFIPRTDEPNYQTVPHMLDALHGKPWYATTKCDGTSTTAYWYRDHFGICSRNYELRDTPTNALWQIAHKYDLEIQYFGHNVAIQWETVGPGIQGNPMGLKQIEPRLFNVYFIDERRYGNYDQLQWYADILDMPIVEITQFGDSFDFTAEQLRIMAEGLYLNGRQREGIVIRPQVEELVQGERLSFKVINLLYKE